MVQDQSHSEALFQECYAGSIGSQVPNDLKKAEDCFVEIHPFAKKRFTQRLNQTEPGQLGKISRRMAEAGVNIEALYSDHDHQLILVVDVILVVDDITRGRAVSHARTQEHAPPDHQT
jgi:hypothetical protein